MLDELQREIRAMYGDKLEKIERWAKFRTTETTREWVELLGPTAVLLTHQEYFVEVAKSLLTGQMPPQDLEYFLMALSVHDLGEITKGDIPAPDKTSRQDKTESTAAIKLIHPLSHAAEVEQAYREVVKGDNDTLHFLFKAIEKTEYVMTAMHVFQKIRTEKGNPEKDLLWLLVARVMAIDFPRALDYAESLPNIIGVYFLEQADLINNMFTESFWRVTDDFAPQFGSAIEKWAAFRELSAPQMKQGATL